MSTSQNFTWNGRREEAAALLAADQLTDEQIAEKVGISRRQLASWKLYPAFAERVDAVRGELRDAVVAEGIADRKVRVAALNDRWRKMQRVIEARAREHADVPGGETGLLVRQVKLVKVYAQDSEDDIDEELEGQPHGGALKRRRRLASMKLSEEIAEYSLDTGLLKEMRDHERQAAQELGQWTEKVDLDARFNYADITDAQLDARIAELEATERAKARKG